MRITDGTTAVYGYTPVQRLLQNDDTAPIQRVIRNHIVIEHRNHNGLMLVYSYAVRLDVRVSLLHIDGQDRRLTYSSGIRSLVMQCQPDTVTLSVLIVVGVTCLLYTSPGPRDRQKSRMPSSA